MQYALIAGLMVCAYAMIAWVQYSRAMRMRGTRERLNVGMEIHHSAYGQTFLYSATRDQTTGQRFAAALVIDPYSSGPAACVHPRADVAIAVSSGCLTLSVGGRKRTLHAGQSFSIPRRTPYRYFNAGHDPVRAQVDASPASALDMFLLQVDRSGLGHGKRGPRAWMQALCLFTTYDCTYLAALPVRLQKGLAMLLWPLARALRIRTYYAE